ncbi:hypothetical protein HYV70_05195 [Candidatus Uhrbacteria bacterium]|nr:hypothetical protein [Candidatus Uhrbacteria bacterium]
MDLNDYPTGRRLFAWKPALLIAGGAVFLIVVVFILVRMFFGNASEEFLLQNLETSSSSVLDACNNTDNPERCRAGYLSDLAQQEISAQACDLLETDAQKDNCYWSIAHVSLDSAYCQNISDAASLSRCKDDVTESQAIDQASVLLCEQMIDEHRRERCVYAVSGPITSQNCLERDPGLCDDISLFEQATVAVDVVYCREIVDEYLALSCVDAVEDLLAVQMVDEGERDSDQDGLTDSQEQTYGSDPQNPDTDGDGYLDGAEVSSGYNPIGSGSLE